MTLSDHSPLPLKKYKIASSEADMCKTRDPQSGYICTRPIAHRGPHAAHSLGLRPVWVWETPKPLTHNAHIVRKNKGDSSK